MIDHVSIGVKNLEKARDFYAPVLALLGYRPLVDNPGTVGFGKSYPEFWLNHRPDLQAPTQDNGCHLCLRARDAATVDQIYALAMELGGTSNGMPGYRPEYHESYYACFFRDADFNHVEVVTFVQEQAQEA